MLALYRTITEGHCIDLKKKFKEKMLQETNIYTKDNNEKRSRDLFFSSVV